MNHHLSSQDLRVPRKLVQRLVFMMNFGYQQVLVIYMDELSFDNILFTLQCKMFIHCDK